MIFHDHAAIPAYPFEDRGIIGNGHRFGIKEIRAVIQLDAVGGRKPCQRIIDLPDDRTGGRGSLQRILPEIAHQTFEGTFLSREKKRVDGLDTERAGLALVQEMVGLFGVDAVARGAEGFDLSVAGLGALTGARGKRRLRHTANENTSCRHVHRRGTARGTYRRWWLPPGNGVWDTRACRAR